MYEPETPSECKPRPALPVAPYRHPNTKKDPFFGVRRGTERQVFFRLPVYQAVAAKGLCSRRHARWLLDDRRQPHHPMKASGQPYSYQHEGTADNLPRGHVLTEDNQREQRGQRSDR